MVVIHTNIISQVVLGVLTLSLAIDLVIVTRNQTSDHNNDQKKYFIWLVRRKNKN